MQKLTTAGLDVRAKPHQPQLTSKCQEALDLNTRLICKKQNRQRLHREGKKCLFFLLTFFFALKTRNQPNKKPKMLLFPPPFRHIHYFLPLKRLLSDFYLFHMPVASTSISFPFYKAAQVRALSASHRLPISLLKWSARNESQK